VCAFSGSVFGARCSVLGVDPVPGPRCQAPGTGFGVRPSVPGLDEGRGKVASPFTPSCLHGRRPDAEDRAGVPENAPVRSASLSCIPRVRVFEDKRLVPGSRSRVPGTRYRINAEGRTPSTEDRARHRKTRTPGLHPASCILHPPSPDKGRVRGKGSTTPLPYCLIALLP